MKQPHKHAALIKAWADGATIQCKPLDSDYWETFDQGRSPAWLPQVEYRIKPEPVEVRLAVLKHRRRGHGLFIGMSQAEDYTPSMTVLNYNLVFDVLDGVPSNPRFEEVSK